MLKHIKNLDKSTCPHCRSKIKHAAWLSFYGISFCPSCHRPVQHSRTFQWVAFALAYSVITFVLNAVFADTDFTSDKAALAYFVTLLILIMAAYFTALKILQPSPKPLFIDNNPPLTALKFLQNANQTEKARYAISEVVLPSNQAPQYVDVNMQCPNCGSTSVLPLLNDVHFQKTFECLDCGCLSQANNTLANDALEHELGFRLFRYIAPVVIIAVAVLYGIPHGMWQAALGVIAACVCWMAYLFYQDTQYKKQHYTAGALVVIQSK